MDIRKLRRKFNEERYAQPWQPPPAEVARIQAILDLVGCHNRVLDIGCRDGSIGQLMCKRGNEVIGIDISETAVVLAREKGLNALRLDVEVEVLPFPEEFFDVVVAAELIEHLYDTDRFLEGIRRVLKKDGFLVLTTPNLGSLGRRLLLLAGRNPIIEVAVSEGSAGHIRYFVKDSLEELLKKHGFIIKFFRSDVINLDNSGNHFSSLLTRLFPQLGKSLIVKCVRI